MSNCPEKKDFNIFEKCIVQPYNEVMEVEEWECESCGMPVRIPLIIDQQFAKFASDILKHICIETEYSPKDIAKMAVELYIEIEKEKEKEKAKGK